MLGPSGSGQDHLPAPDRRASTCRRGAHPADGGRRFGRSAVRARRQHGLPGLRALPAPVGARERGLRPERMEGRRGAPARRASGACARAGRARRHGRAPAGRFRAGSGSASRSPARSSTSPACCCSTSRSARSTSSCASRCRSSSRRCSASSASPSCTSRTTRARRCRCRIASPCSTTGGIEQVDTPRALYDPPRTVFVAGFVGTANVVDARAGARRLTGRDRSRSAIRPEQIVAPRRASVHDGSVRVARARSSTCCITAPAVAARVRIDERIDARRSRSAPNPAHGEHGPARRWPRGHGGAGVASGATPGAAGRRWTLPAARSPCTAATRSPRARCSAPPLLWLGSSTSARCSAMVLQSVVRFDDFTARVVPELTLANYRELLTQPAHLDIVAAHAADGGRRHARCRRIAFPIASTWRATPAAR